MDGRTQDDWKRVADAIHHRLGDAGMLQIDLVRQAGVSDVTVRALMRGTRASYRADTLARVSRALGWPPNTLHRVSLGDPVPDDPVPDNDDDLAAELEEISRRLEAARLRLAQRRGR